MTTEQKLKPCAHCGSEDIRTQVMPYFGAEIKKVTCYGCGITTKYDRKSIEKWNRRV